MCNILSFRGLLCVMADTAFDVSIRSLLALCSSQTTFLFLSTLLACVEWDQFVCVLKSEHRDKE